MMNDKILRNGIFSLFMMFGCTPSLRPDALTSAQNPMRDIEPIDVEFCDNPLVEQTINDTQWFIDRSCNKESLVGTLNELGIVHLLQQNFFLHSNNINSRPLLDYPDFLLWRHDGDKDGVVVNLFYNQTSACFFTKGSTNICSYLAVSQPNFLDALDTILSNPLITSQLPFNKSLLFDLLNLFTPFTVQERRLGFMLCGKRKFGYLHGSIQVPWYYLERNHFVNPDLQEDIEDTVAEITGVPTEQVNQADQTAFQDAHFISDKLGIGDTRLMIDYAVLKRSFWTMRVGGLVTFPTAVAMTKGIKGSTYCRFSQPPILDLCAVVDTALNPSSSLAAVNGITQATDYFLDALDNLSAMLLESPLGNGGHFELGVYMKNKFPVSMYLAQPWSRRLVYRSFTAIQYQLPAWETRSFIMPVNLVAFSQHTYDFPAGEDTQNTITAQSDYDFLTQQLTQRLFPIALHVKVHPKWIFRMSSQMAYEAPKGGFAVGTDTWIRSGESFSAIQGLPSVVSQIDICDAKAPFAYQAKIFGRAYFKKEKPAQLWAFGFGVDYTYWSKGIGQDFLGNFFIDVTF